jgi:hypothetical protein
VPGKQYDCSADPDALRDRDPDSGQQYQRCEPDLAPDLPTPAYSLDTLSLGVIVTYNTSPSNGLKEVNMNRLIHARMLLAIAIATTIGVLEFGSMIVPEAPSNAPKSASLASPDHVTILSTISVSAPEAVPTLPLVIVRPPAATISTFEPVVVVAAVARQRSAISVSAALPHVRLDMPYYSFGKMLPNVIKD